MVMQWPAKPSTPVRFRPQPPQFLNKKAAYNSGFFMHVTYIQLISAIANKRKKEGQLI
jgi:hypothetical protein